MIFSESVITSRVNPTVKWAASLTDRKGREESAAFLAEGIKLTVEAAAAGLPVTDVFLAAGRRGEYLPRLTEAFSSPRYAATRLTVVEDGVFAKISTEKAPQGVISVIKYLDFFQKKDIIYKEDFFLLPRERALALYSVRDPGNLGSVIRSAVAFGVDHLVVSDDCADLYHPRTVRAAMGALFRVKCTAVGDFGSFVSAARSAGRAVYAAELSVGARSVTQLRLTPSDVFVIGNEGHGIPQTLSALCTGSAYIPISGRTESLNAAVAAAVLMWEQGKVSW